MATRHLTGTFTHTDASAWSGSVTIVLKSTFATTTKLYLPDTQVFALDANGAVAFDYQVPDVGYADITIHLPNGKSFDTLLGAGASVNLVTLRALPTVGALPSGLQTLLDALSSSIDPLLQALGTNLLPHGGMEGRSDYGRRWYPFGQNDTFTQVTEYRPGSPGAHAMKITIPPGGISAAVNGFSLMTYGHQYLVTFWARSIDLDQGCFFCFANEDWIKIPFTLHLVLSTEWTRVSFEYDVQWTVSHVLFGVDGSPGQSGLFDDLSIQEILLLHEVPSELPDVSAGWTLKLEDHFANIAPGEDGD